MAFQVAPRGAFRASLRGAFQTLAIIASFVGFGLAWAQVEAASARSPAAYPSPGMERDEPGMVCSEPSPSSASAAPHLWLIDGFNVLHVVVLGGRDRAEWWTAPRRAELLERAAGFDDPRAEIWVVFDGSRAGPDAASGPGVHQVFAASADAWLLERVRSHDEPARVAVVTADRELASRARHRGAQVISPKSFLERCAG